MTDRTYPTIILIAGLFRLQNLLYVTSTTGGNHASGSYHYKGEAVDFGSGVENAAEVKANKTTRWSVMNQQAAWWYEQPKWITELVHTAPGDTSGWYIKYGVKRAHGFYGKVTDVAHENHVHVAIATQVAADHLLTLRVQQLLHITADGINGPQTQAAIKIFQAHNGLTHDGVVGPQTVKALRAAQGWKPL